MLVWLGQANNFISEIHNSIKKIYYLLQRDSAIFTVAHNVEEVYDAYEKDIAIVSFYFKEATLFEYTK